MNASDYIFTRQRPLLAPVSWSLNCGKADEKLRTIPKDTVKLFLTSPPYYGKFDYGVDGQCGLESSLAEYLEYQTVVAKEMLRVATPDANLFLVIQDTFNNSGGTGGDFSDGDGYRIKTVRGPREKDYPRKAQLLVPERLRISYTDAGWVPLLKIIWDKSDPRRGAQDRPSYSYEEILAFSREGTGDALYEEIMLFSASPKHYFDRGAVLAPFSTKSMGQLAKAYLGEAQFNHAIDGTENPSETKRRIIKCMKEKPGAFLRAVWKIASGNQPVIEHDGKVTRGVASFPMLLAEICVNLGSAPGDLVCDPYSGLGTTMLAALKWGRSALGIELNSECCDATKYRLRKEGF